MSEEMLNTPFTLTLYITYIINIINRHSWQLAAPG